MELGQIGFTALAPKKRRALVGSFVLGLLVIAFFSTVLAVQVPEEARAADREPEMLSGARTALAREGSLPSATPSRLLTP